MLHNIGINGNGNDISALANTVVEVIQQLLQNLGHSKLLSAQFFALCGKSNLLTKKPSFGVRLLLLQRSQGFLIFFLNSRQLCKQSVASNIQKALNPNLGKVCNCCTSPSADPFSRL